MSTLARTHLTLRRMTWTLLFAAAACAALLAGCGGGGEGGVGTGGTGTYVSGTISGFGSIIVNDVRFDDSRASVFDDDDSPLVRDQLKLGMTVSIDSDAIRSDATGRNASANRIRVGSELAGPVSAVQPAAGTLGLLGQTVRVGALTVFDERLAGGLAAIAVGQTIEVFAQYDAASASYSATRIESRAVLAPWHLRGPVAAVDTVSRRLRIGALDFDYAAAAGVPATLAVGDIVRVRVNRVAGPFGGWFITAFGTGVRAPADRDEAELKGLVGGFVSPRQFSVNGLAVDASAASFPDGSDNLKPGVRVEVSGSLSAGVLRATQVSIESEDEQRKRGFELKGTISAVDTAARRFTLRGQAVSWARSDLRLDDGTLDDIRVGREVEVKAQLSAERTGLEATRIKFE
jgi:hypothetical protein